MKTKVFLYYGNRDFSKLTAIQEDLKLKTFNSINKDSELLTISDVFLGFSYLLFKAGLRMYHCGFLNPVCNDFSTEIFNEINEEITNISTTLKHLFIITKNGKCYFCPTLSSKPTELYFESSDTRIKQVECGDIHNIILTDDGLLYKCDVVQIAIMPFPMPCQIFQVACGKEHVLMLSHSGQVFTYGCGNRGQLGHGDISSQDDPTLVEALDGISISTIAAGGWHSAAISCQGDLYMWGWNESGQLGLPCAGLENGAAMEEIEVICCVPKYIEIKNDLRVVSVSCGSRHSVILAEDVSVWSWGFNGHDQLGPKKCAFKNKFEIDIPQDFVPYKIKCNFWSTLIYGFRNE